MKKYRLSFILNFFFLIIFFLPTHAQQNIFVSIKGNDQNNGSISHPLASLAQAIVLAKKSHSKNIHIQLREGTFYLNTPIQIDADVVKDKSLHISAYQNEQVQLSGARQLFVKWERYNDHIYAAKINIDFAPDALYINDQPAILSRYPNYQTTARVFNGVASDAIGKERVQSWGNPKGGYLHAMHAGEWGSFHYRILEKDSVGNLIKEGGWQNNRPSPLHDQLRFVENIFEELDAPNEWFFDKNTSMLYYFPAKQLDLNRATIALTKLQNLITIKGKENQPVKHLKISNIHFVQTNRTLFEKHEPLLRSDWQLHRGGAIVLENTAHLQIEHCVFTQLGAHAIMVSGYNKNTTIKNNHMYNIGQSGICFIGDTAAVRNPLFAYNALPFITLDVAPGPKNNKFPENALVENNLIHDIGQIEKQATGVEISMSQYIRVKNNTIYNTPRAGINIGDGTWGGHIIEFNDVFNTVLETGDHGAFNSWGRDRYWNANRAYMDSITTANPALILLDAVKPTIIRNNRFRCDHGWDIDLDDGSSNYEIYNNICLNGGIKLREGFYRMVENNIMINNSFHPHVWFNNSGDIFRKNIVTRNYYPILVNDWGKEIDYNFFPDSVSLNKSKKNHTDHHSIYGNPMFTDANKGDFKLIKQSLAFKVGFKEIDTKNIGVQDAALKNIAQKISYKQLLLPLTANDEEVLHSFFNVKLRKVKNKEDQSAYGLPSSEGLIVESLNTTDKIITGLLPKDVIVEAEGEKVNAAFDLISIYEKINWTGKMALTIYRNQQKQQLTFSFK
jgi:hypothetical protein